METLPVGTDVAAMVRAGRAVARMTQAQLAKALGMRRGRLSLIENGDLLNVRVSEIRAFERVLGIPPSAWTAHETAEEREAADVR